MNMKLSSVLIIGAIAAMGATPLWASSDTAKEGTDAATKTELGQPTRAEERMMGATSVMPFNPHATASDYRIGNNALYTLSADKLEGMEVVDRAGEKVGTIKSIVLAPDRRRAHAVITAGGFLGMGARDVMVSLSDLRQTSDDVVQMSATQAQILALQEYTADPYVELKGDDPIGVSFVSFSAFEAGKDLPAARAQSEAGSVTRQSVQDQQTPGSASARAPGQTTAAAAQMRADSRPATAGTRVGDNPLYTRSAASLNGMEVINSAGESFGTIKHVVLAPTRDGAYAVISAGGLLGMGARDILLSLDDLNPVGDKLQFNATQDQINALSDYTPQQYVEVKGDTPVSGSIVEFSALEADKDGAASKNPTAPK